MLGQNLLQETSVQAGEALAALMEVLLYILSLVRPLGAS